MTPETLLVSAKHLTPAGPGRPSHAMLRRSISTSYYALFNALQAEAARPFRAQARPAAWRLPDHGAAREVCGVLVKRQLIPWMDGTPVCHPKLVDFAQSFLVLQHERHSADYVYGYAPTKSAAQTLLGHAGHGIRSLELARNAVPEQVQVMCLAMSASPAVRRRMRRG